jgi:hypothetical protein
MRSTLVVRVGLDPERRRSIIGISYDMVNVRLSRGLTTNACDENADLWKYDVA